MTEQDSVQGLIDYVTLIKPFHTKIIEVLIEHEHQERINATINDACSLDESIVYVQSDDDLNLMEFGSNDELRTHGDPIEFILTSPDLNNSFVGNSSETQAINIDNQYFIISGDQRQYFQTNDIVEVDLYHDEYPTWPIHIDDFSGNTMMVTGDISFLINGNTYYIYGGSLEGEQPFTVVSKTMTSITVVETLNDSVIGKYFGLSRTPININTLANLFTVDSVQFSTGTLNSWPGYPDVSQYQLGNVPHTIITVLENIEPQFPYETSTFSSIDGKVYNGNIVPTAIVIDQMIDDGTFITGIIVTGNRTNIFRSGFQFDIVGGNCEGLYTTMHSYESSGQTFVYVAERFILPVTISLGVAKIHRYGLNQYSSIRPRVPQTNVECYIRENLMIELDPPI